MLFGAVSCNGANGNGYFCEPPIDREIQRAEQLESTEPSKATVTWQNIDRQLTNDAVWIPTLDSREVEITSPRLRNYEYNPVWGFLADQAWLQ